LNSKAVAEILLTYPDINPQWILTGEGEVHTKDAEPASQQTKEVQAEYRPAISSKSGVPYYDVDFVGGFDLVFEEHSLNPTYFIDFTPFNYADCWVNVTGKSMSPFISHGALVVLKKMETRSDFLLFGELYAVVTDEYRTIKIVAAGKDD